MHFCDHKHGKTSGILRGKCTGNNRDPGVFEEQAAEEQRFAGLGFH